MSVGRTVSSRRRFREYLKERRERLRRGGDDGSMGFVQGEEPRRGTRSRAFFTLFRAFWGLLRGHRASVIAALGTLSVSAALVLMMPLFTKVAIDYAILGNAWPEWAEGIAARLPRGADLLWLIAGVMVSVTFGRTVVGILGRWQMTRLTKRVQVSMRRRVFDHAVRLPLFRVQQLKSGGVASMLREDAGGAADLLFHMIYNPWNAVIQLMGALVMLALADWRMLAGALLLIPAVWFTHKTWVSRIRPLYRDIKSTRVAIDSHATEAFGGMRVVRGFNREAGEAGRFVRGSHLMARQEILTWWWSRGIDLAWQVMVPLASTGVLVYGGLAVMRGTMTVGDVMMFIAYVLMLLGPLEVLATSATEMQNALASFDRVLDVLDEPREFQGGAAGVVLEPARVRARVTLRDVRFAYPASGKLRAQSSKQHMDAEGPRHVIKGVSLDVAPGETIALVGPSGSGKTTLCNLVARFYDPQEGRVELDGRDLREIDVDSYRRLLGIVEQDVFLFDGTVAENIGYARREATAQQIEAAARAAHAHEFIEKLEQGYETVIGERGVRLSGGQKQRLAIARAVLADPKILILDEATSNLDTESERLIQRSLARLMKGRTCFVIAHRLSTIRHANRIVVIEDGRITETGTHDELLARGGRYAEFLKAQVEGHPPASSAGAGERERVQSS